MYSLQIIAQFFGRKQYVYEMSQSLVHILFFKCTDYPSRSYVSQASKRLRFQSYSNVSDLQNRFEPVLDLMTPVGVSKRKVGTMRNVGTMRVHNTVNK
jgi:hypothetical protein